MLELDKFVQIYHKKIHEDTIIHYPEVEDLCYRAYPYHPKGCPNKEKCQKLNIPDFNTFLDCNPNWKYHLLYAEFDFKGYIQMRKEKFPNHTKGQLRNILWWQGRIKNLLKLRIKEIQKDNVNIYVFGCGSGMKLSFQKQVGSMENVCINVFSTMKLNGIKLEIHPVNKIYLVCLLCSKKELKFDIKEKSITDFIFTNNYENVEV